ncbi:lectin subunit alpha-like [Lucilia sericata]|uniref:lectin subunit alpha-like n=1 Tax=Lucilia sericata TaxID=13632 RepID=UPI0018A872D5|nr:lectin subunit alpha-like [Lucilia sericata]
MNISKETWKVILFLVFAQSILAKAIEFKADNGELYILEPSEEYNWYQAWLTCSHQNGQLINLNTEEKSKLLHKIFESNQVQFTNFWIGGKASVDENNSPFYWQSLKQEFSYAQWDENQPNKSLTEPLCVYITKNSEVPYSWRSDTCYDLKLGYICERSEYSNSPTIKQHINFKDHNKIDELSQYSLLPKNLNKLGNYTTAWRDLVRKAIRKTQINIVRSFFQIEHFIAKLRGIKENVN